MCEVLENLKSFLEDINKNIRIFLKYYHQLLYKLINLSLILLFSISFNLLLLFLFHLNFIYFFMIIIFLIYPIEN